MKKSKLYLECYSGISGDMTVAALLDLGADQKVLMDGLKSLNVDGYRVVISRKTRNSIEVCDFDVILEGNEHSHSHEHHLDNNENHVNNHEHTLSHHHNHDHIHEHPHDHNHDHEYNHEHEHDHDHHTHDHAHADFQVDHATLRHNHNTLHLGHHEHRNLHDINEIIEHSSITPHAKEIAKRIFRIVAEAEAKAHGKPIEEVHFHEVGAIDSIVDIVATAICLDNLNITEVIVSELYEGTGQIRCQHGILPIPVPAVVNISSAYQLPLHITSMKGELITPTGAAIVAAIRTSNTLPQSFKVMKIGLGGGKREYEVPSILRAMLIEDTSTVSTVPTDTVWVLEANIDDCSGEALSFAMELLLERGAKDVYYTPIYMKKNRPAYLMGVLCAEDKIAAMEDILFTHTTTIGIRRTEVMRSTLSRESHTVSTPYGQCTVKVCSYNGHQYLYPEFEDIKSLCIASDMDYQSMYRMVQSYAEQQLEA